MKRIIGEREGWICYITESECGGAYDIALHQKHGDYIFPQNILLGFWARTVGGAKKQINQDSGLTAKDWTWKEVEA